MLRRTPRFLRESRRTVQPKLQHHYKKMHESYSGYPTFDNIKYYGVVEFDTKDHKLLEFIAVIFETFSINYDNVDSLMDDEMCYQCNGSCGYHHFTNFDDFEELEDYVNRYYKLNSKSLSILKKYFNKPKIYAFLILDDNLFIIDIKSAQNTLEYFRDNYDDEDE